MRSNPNPHPTLVTLITLTLTLTLTLSLPLPLPLNQVFFSTCYRKVALTGFDLLPEGPPPPPPPPAPWRVGGLCLTCASAATGPTTGYWELADTCSMCDSNGTLPPGTLVPRVSVVSVACFGLANANPYPNPSPKP